MFSKGMERNNMGTKDTKAECSSTNICLPPAFSTEKGTSLLKQTLLGNLYEINLQVLKILFS